MDGLTPQQQEFYASMEMTFMSPGWALMTQGWREEQEKLPLDTFFNAKDMDYVRAARVRFKLLDELINLPATIAQQKLNVVDNAENEYE
jgi:hypothetical protein